MNQKKFIDQKEIAEQVERLALDILGYCKAEKIENLCVIWIAEGAIFFVVDLLRHLESIECEIHSIKASSYGNDTVSSGKVKIEGNFNSLENKDILLVDDILETGLTLQEIIKEIKLQNPKSVKTCVLLDKNKPQSILKADFKCFDIEDKFVFGYGLDIAKAKRNSRDIFIKA